MLAADKVQRAFELWVKLTGVDPKANFDLSKCSFQVHNANEGIERALKMDPTLALPLLVMDYYLDEWLGDNEISIKNLVKHYDTGLLDKVIQCRELQDLLHEEELNSIVVSVRESFKQIQKDYDLDPEFLNTLEDKFNISFFYRDCLWAIENLHLYKITQPVTPGDPTNEPKLVKSIHEFQSSSELLDFMSHSVNCIVMGYIPNPENGIEYSSFGFAFRRGNEVYLLTDLPRWEHPLQEGMTRKRHKEDALDVRTGACHFPYYTLAEIHEIEENSEITDIALPSNGPLRFPGTLATYPQLRPDESYWAIFVAGLIKKKFFVEKAVGGKEIIHARDACRKPLVLPSGSDMNIPATGETIIDYLHQKVKENLAGSHPKEQYAWMLKKYQDKVEPSMLFLTSDINNGLLSANYELKLLPGSEELKLTTTAPRKVGLVAMNLNQIGTPEELEADRIFLARYNESKMILHAAIDDFDQTHVAIWHWYEEHVRNNLEALLKGIAYLSFIVEKGSFGDVHDPKSFLDFEGHAQPKTGSILYVVDDKEYNYTTCEGKYFGCTSEYGGHYCIEFGGPLGREREARRMVGPLYIDGGYDYKHGRHCVLTGNTRASIEGVFCPKTGYALAALAGVKFEELPDVLQHWRPLEQYTGNSITTRVDPLEWALDNPWRKLMDFDVHIRLSRSGFNDLRRKYNLEPNKFWITEKEKEEQKEKERRERKIQQETEEALKNRR
jgi:hypothetical protein